MSERIRIIATPPGQAPKWVREEWVGLEVNVEENAPEPGEGIQLGVKAGKPENLGGYPVRTSDAISALRKKSPQAAEWWEINLPLGFIPRFVFDREACEIIPETPANEPSLNSG